MSSITIGEAQLLDVHTLPILWCPLCCANTIGTAIHAPLIGEGQGRNKNPQKHLIGAANAPCFAIGAESAIQNVLKFKTRQ